METELPAENARQRTIALTSLTARDVNLLLELLILVALGSGLASWWLGDQWSGWAVLVHVVSGLALLVLTPAKMMKSVRTGLRRGRTSRWVSIGFGILTLATILLGILHATGVWFGVGTWSPLWTHQLFAFALIPFLIWHLVSRPSRPHIVDFSRRSAVRGGAIIAAAGALFVTQEVGVRWAQLSGRDRRFTGSHEAGSFNPAEMPSTIWIDDRTPANTNADSWLLTIEGELVSIDSLNAASRPVVATLDCTGGWYSEQSWDAVPLSELITNPSGRSVRVKSSTGFARLFSHHELDNIFLATGYNGQPLERRHGAPARLVVPGQRGPMWIKWVTSIESDDQAPWLQTPLPLT